MSACPKCGARNATGDLRDEAYWRTWTCLSYVAADEEFVQSITCARAEGRRQGHLEAVWQFALDLNAVADRHPVSLVDDELVEIPRDSWMWLMKAATRLRRRLARMRRQG